MGRLLLCTGKGSLILMHENPVGWGVKDTLPSWLWGFNARDQGVFVVVGVYAIHHVAEEAGSYSSVLARACSNNCQQFFVGVPAAGQQRFVCTLLHEGYVG